MGADGQLLQGEVNESPESTEIDVEAMLLGFLKELVLEQKAEHPVAAPEAGNA